jgi:hypothetical protein
MGRSDGRQWGDPVAAYGEIPMAAVTIRTVCVVSILTGAC